MSIDYTDSTDFDAARRAEIEAEVAGRTLCDLVARNAQTHAGWPALSWKDGGEWRTLSWAQCRRRAAEVAMGLRALGVGRGDFVAIMARNRPEHLIADMAVVHAGATPVSLYSTLAPEQIAYIGSHCEAKAAIVEGQEFLARWEKARPELPRLERVVLIEDAAGTAHAADTTHAVYTAHTADTTNAAHAARDGFVSWDALVARGRDALAADPEGFDASWRAVRPDDLATLVYTSGTTGPPKGVMLTHRNVLWTCASARLPLALDAGITGISYLPLAHALARFADYYMGVYLSAHGFFCPEVTEVFKYAAEIHPQSFNGVPRVWEKLQAGILAQIAAAPAGRRRIAERAIDAGRKAARLRQAGRRLPTALRLQQRLFDRLVFAKVRKAIGLDRCVFAGAGAAPMSPEVVEFFAALGITIHDGYGLTECTAPATLSPRQEIKIGWSGRALPGAEVRLADDGEVLVRGGNVAAGYYKDPEQTAQVFDAGGWLHTGDIGELDDDGWLRIVDRKKELIITAGGKNISPANLETLLRRHVLVGSAFAFGDRKPYVVALVVLDSDTAPAWAQANGLPFTSLPAFAAHLRVRAEVEQAVRAANQHVSHAEQIKRFTILPAEWTTESELTPTLKLKRRVIERKYAEELAALYR